MTMAAWADFSSQIQMSCMERNRLGFRLRRSRQVRTGCLQIRVRLCDAACEALASDDDAAARCDSTVASCIAEAAP